MRFKIEDHDVTCLCALVDLPKRVIVEELPPRGGRARFQVQGFTSGAVGGLLEWLEPVMGGARVRRWHGEFAYARIEFEDPELALFARDLIEVLAARELSGLQVAARLREEPVALGARVGALAAAMAG